MQRMGCTREQAVREIALRLTNWRENLSSAPNRAEYLLNHFNEAWKHTIQEGDALKRSNNQHYLVPNSDIRLCLNCWGLGADVCDYDKNGDFRRGSMFSLVVKSFNNEELSGENLYPSQSEDKIGGRGEHASLDGEVYAWLKTWLPGNTDATPFAPDKLHLDAPSKDYVYQEMCSEWRHQGREPPSSTTFLRVLRGRFKLILHKHKKFAECQVCSLFKELWAKSKHEAPQLRTEIKELRKTHLGEKCALLCDVCPTVCSLCCVLCVMCAVCCVCCVLLCVLCVMSVLCAVCVCCVCCAVCGVLRVVCCVCCVCFVLRVAVSVVCALCLCVLCVVCCCVLCVL